MSQDIFTSQNVDTITATGAGTWTCPAGVTEIVVECWGAGGGGNGRLSSIRGGAAGGGGGYSRKTLTVSPGTIYNLSIGTGGNGASSNGNGGNGGDTYFDLTSTVLAKGGLGATSSGGGNGGQSASGVGDIKFSGGLGSSPLGSKNLGGGGGGGSGGYLNIGGSGAGGGASTGGAGGPGGPDNGGNGGAGGNLGVNNGVNGSTPGGGGGGGGNNGSGSSGNGGNGANGKIVITYYNIWTCPTGITSVDVECWGAGGGGENVGDFNHGAGGGGGGAYSKKTISVTPGTLYQVNVGSFGKKGYQSASIGPTNGGDSWFLDSSTILAKGGSKASGNFGGAGGQSSSGIGTTKFSGGNGGSGPLKTFTGSGGASSAGTAANGNNGNPAGAISGGTGGSAPTGGGAGGTGGNGGTFDNGQDGSNPGGGGGGGGGTLALGGNGAFGKIVLTYQTVYSLNHSLTITDNASISSIQKIVSDTLTFTQALYLVNQTNNTLSLTHSNTVEIIHNLIQSLSLTQSLVLEHIHGPIHNLSLTQSLICNVIWSRSLTDNLSLIQLVSKELSTIVNNTLVLSHNINFEKYYGLIHSLNLNQIVAYIHEHPQSIQQSLTLIQDVTVTKNISPLFLALSHNLSLNSTVVTINSIFSQTVIDNLNLIQTVQKITNTFTSFNNLVLSDFANASRGLLNNLNLTQSVNLVKSKGPNNNLNLTQTVNQTVMRTINLVQSLNLRSRTLAINFNLQDEPTNTNTCRYTPIGSIETPPAYSPRKTIILTYPFDIPSLNIVLRSPNFEDTEKDSFNKILRETRGGTQKLYRNSDWPKTKKLSFEVSFNKWDEVETYLDFINQSLGKEIGLVDYLSRQWKGILYPPEIQFSEATRANRQINLEFEGIIIPPSVPLIAHQLEWGLDSILSISDNLNLHIDKNRSILSVLVFHQAVTIYKDAKD